MPYQYIHTSAKRGLEPGKSGFCCVARDRNTPPDLILELERMSGFEATPGAINPVILRMAHVETRKGPYRILSRIQDAGIDYSKRNNHIAHHLVFQPEELSQLPDPATILLSWRGWKDSWSAPPSILNERDQFDIADLDTVSSLAKHSTNFESLEDNGKLVSRSLLISPGEETLVTMWFRQQLQHIPNDLRWEFPFTSFLLSSDKPTDFAWSCNWKGRELPYELELVGKPWHVQIEDSIGDPILLSEEPDHPEMIEEVEGKPLLKKKFAAPRVEIPKELDRSKLKRPKAKWTPKRFNKTMNLSILLIAAICIAVVYFFISGLKESDIEAVVQMNLPASKAPQAPSNPEPKPTVEDLNNEWKNLLDQRLLYGAKQSAHALAQALQGHGIATPAEQLEFLDQARSSSQTVRVPASALNATDSQISLDPDLAYYLQQGSFHLCPATLNATLREIASLLPAITQIYDRLPAQNYQGESVSIGLRALKRQLFDELKSDNITAWGAAQTFQQQLSELQDSPQLSIYLKLHAAFEQPPKKGFLSLDKDGLVDSSDERSYTQYAVELFENYVLPRYNRFEPNPAFTAALKRLDAHPNSLQYVYEAILAARPIKGSFKERWQTISSVWRQAFVRFDLMEETLVSYAIERLEESKADLIALQLQFEANDLQRYHTLKKLEPQIEKAILQAEAAGLEEEWIVIPDQIAHRRQ